MAVWVLIGFWIVLGVGILLVAMGSTRRRRASGRESRASRRATALGFVALFAIFGLGLPALTLVINSDSDADAKGGVDLTKAQVEGRELFSQNCANCHTLAASNAVGRVGPNLDVLRPNEALTLDAIKNGRARGTGQMPPDLLQSAEARDVASYVAAVAGQ